MYEIKQSTAETLVMFAHDSAGTPVTGLTDGTFTKRISKGSGSFGAMTVTITEMELGFYSIPLSTSHSDTTGILTLIFTNAGAEQINLQWRVEARLVDDLNNFDATSDDVAVVTLVNTTTTNTDMVGTDSAATAAEMAKVPKSDGTATWNATALASINAEADTALTDYDPPTRTEATSDKAEIITDLDDIKGTGFVKDTHSLFDIEGYVDILDDGTSGNAKIATDVAAVLVDTADIQPKIGTPASDVSADIAAVKVDTAAILVDTGTTLPAQINSNSIVKNASLSNFEFLMVLASDSKTPGTGLTVTGQKSIDGAAFSSVSGTIAEVSNGYYQFDALAADTNGDLITWKFSAATADDTGVTFLTI